MLGGAWMFKLSKLLYRSVDTPELEIVKDITLLPESIAGNKIFEIIDKNPTLAFKLPTMGRYVQFNYRVMSTGIVETKFSLQFIDKTVSLVKVTKGGEKIIWADLFCHIPQGVEKILIEFTGEDLLSLNIEIKKINFLMIAFQITKQFFKKRGFSFKTCTLFARRCLSVLLKRRSTNIAQEPLVVLSPASHEITVLWEGVCQHIADIKLTYMPYRPGFSVIMPVYNTPLAFLQKAIESVLNQSYPYWELCIADDASTIKEIRPLLEQYAQQDKRIKLIFLNQNSHIAVASNAALSLATQEFITFLDHDDELHVDALLENAVLLNRHPEADMIYSDEDKITPEGEYTHPFFKPDWSPDYFLSGMYTCHLGVYRASLVREIGGFRKGFEGSQDYDFVLRFTEKTQRIFHIPKILYHWRILPGSAALSSAAKPYAYTAAFRAIKEALSRRPEGEGADVRAVPNYLGHFYVDYGLRFSPLISIIIPTRDGYDLLKACVDSIFDKTSYENFEVIIIDNGSQDLRISKFLSDYAQKYATRFFSIRLDIPFNFSRLNNEAVKLAHGELLLFLNNDTRVITKTWLEQMAGYAMRPSIGAVGALLLYADDTIQHAGIVMGVHTLAAHGHKHFSLDMPGYCGRLLGPSNYAAVTGACLMVKKSDFLAAGGFEEQLTVAFNDVDFCLKLHTMGKYNVVLPDVKLYHFESKSRGTDDTPEKQRRFAQEQIFMRKKWQNIIDHDPFYHPHLTREREDFSIA